MLINLNYEQSVSR